MCPGKADSRKKPETKIYLVTLSFMITHFFLENCYELYDICHVH
jgi:hypothetical protein